MGDIADMMLDGTLDMYTGEYIDGDSPGYPRTLETRPTPKLEKIKCKYCEKLIAPVGIEQHNEAKHKKSEKE